MKKIIILICSLFLLCSCYDYRELNDTSIVSGIGIDYKNNKYIVNLEITKSSKDSSSTQVETNIIKGEDENLSVAISNAVNNSNKDIYMEHVELLILGKELCNQGIGKVVDYIIRDIDINNNYSIVIADDPGKLLNEKIKNDSVSNLIVTTLEYYYGKTSFDDIDIIASLIINKYKDVAFPYVNLENENIIFNEIYFFNNDKTVGTINNKMYNFLVLDSVDINFNNNGDTINIFKKDISFEVKKNLVEINIKGYGLVKEINKNMNLQDPNSYKKIEKNINKIIKKETTDFLNKTLKKESDLLGLENQYYKRYKKDMKDLKFKVNVDIVINRNGTIYEVLNDN